MVTPKLCPIAPCIMSNICSNFMHVHSYLYVILLADTDRPPPHPHPPPPSQKMPQYFQLFLLSCLISPENVIKIRLSVENRYKSNTHTHPSPLKSLNFLCQYAIEIKRQMYISSEPGVDQFRYLRQGGWIIAHHRDGLSSLSEWHNPR